jgi:integrating conjugative element protein (TIGR03759 family)
MTGAAGKKYPHLTPPEVLGIVAKTTSARRHYAELVVAQQKKQLTQELAFNRAVQEAWHRLYPDLKPIAPFDMRAFAPK